MDLYLQQLAREIMVCFKMQITLFCFFLLISIAIWLYLRLKEDCDKRAKERALEKKKILYSPTKKKKKKTRSNNFKKRDTEKKWSKSKIAIIFLPPISLLLSFLLVAGFLIPMLMDYTNESIITVNVINCSLEKERTRGPGFADKYYYSMDLRNGEKIILKNDIGLLYDDLNESIDKPMFKTGLSGEELFKDGDIVINSAIVTYAKRSREILEFKVLG